MSIVHIPDEIKQEFKVHADGSTSISVFAAARLIGIDQTSLTETCLLGKKHTTFAKFVCPSNFELLGLSEDRITDTLFSLILKYYAYKSKVKSEYAKLLDMAMTAIGVRTWIKSELGIAFQPVSQRKSVDCLTTDDLEMLELHQEFGDSSHPDTLLEGIDPIFWDMPKQVIQHLLAVRKYDRLNRSVESRVLLYRKIRMETLCGASEDEARSAVKAGEDLSVSHILKKHSECDRASELTGVCLYKRAATDQELINSAKKYQRKIDKKLTASGTTSRLIEGK